MFADQLARVMEIMGAAANMIPLVALDDGGDSLFADAVLSHDHDPLWFRARASFRGG